MSLIVYMNGQFVKEEDAKVSIWDHGYLYGDGIFEGIRAYNGRLFRLREHLVRLYRSARSLKLPVPLEIEDMEKAVIETCRKNNLKDAYIRLIVSRGVGDLGIDIRKCKSGSQVCIIADKITLYPNETYETGVKDHHRFNEKKSCICIASPGQIPELS